MLNLNNLKHKYFAVRHGHSVSNEQGILVGSLINGVKSEYGLTEKGMNQVKLSAELYKLQCKNNNYKVVIIYSPFSRTKETASIIADILGCDIIRENANLKERDFGDFELKSASNHPKILEQDKINPDSTFGNSESINTILSKMLNVITNCENLNIEPNQNIFLITHADSSTILETAFRSVKIENYHDLPSIRNAEIRALN
jgi:glucosyl-3-phosphoglycerate phosphatase